MQWSLCTCSTCMFILTEALGLEVTWFDAQEQLLSLFQVYSYWANAAISYLCFIRPRYKIRGAPMGQCRVDIYYRCTAFWLLYPILVHLLLKHRGNVFFFFFRQDMVERIALEGRCSYQAKIKVTVYIYIYFFFLRKPSKTQKKIKS